ncbi:TlpA family protein disulfide reductase [Clostridium vincentii]|uniref:Thiol-disulfide oxidoreductase ResA n=1 Tax=Clostridium vincentii TaxID=52704 RepID=A0A2T0B951_9CLOT|nr:TlpA disulfide reductase family protein [Clostridium vincentii]PRR80385.1 Thiol-disulfide oxidoreductase ResA [Clostridium vincentii]
MKNKKLILSVIGFVGFLAISYFGYNFLNSKYNEENITEVEKNETSNEVEQKDKISNEVEEQDKTLAKDFAVYDENLKEVKLSDYKGTPVVVNFWASWCPPCKSEMPSFNEMSAKYNEDEVVILMVNLTDGQRETTSIAKEYIKDNNFDMKVLFDTESNASSNYKISSIPRTIFIDKDGYIVEDQSGTITKEKLESQIKLLLK